jgi:hypothetical protein
MLCKRIVPTLLALLLPLVLLLGCGGANDPASPPGPPPPPLSSEVGLAGLSLSAGQLSPAFNSNGRSYTATVGVLGEQAVGVTVTLKDTKASLTINDNPVASGQATNFRLNEGANTIRMKVTAEDGVSIGLTTLTLNRLPFNTRVLVLNGISGVSVENTMLKLTDSSGNVLAENVPLPKAKNGAVMFGLDPKEKYNIYAKGDNSAAACYANFDPSREDTAALYCLRNSTVFYELEAPIIEDIRFGAADEDAGGAGGWKIMANNAYYVGPASSVAAIRVTALTRNPLAGSTDVYGTGYAVPPCVNIDGVASVNAGVAAGVVGTAISVNAPVTVGGKQWYRSIYRCAVPTIPTDIFNKEHFADIVVYDCIGNRVEQRVYLTITDSSNSQMSDPDLTAVAPTWVLRQAQTFTGGGDLPGGPGYDVGVMNPTEPYNGVQQVLARFNVVDGGANQVIRGYDVWRSNGNQSNFVKIGTVNYATATTGPFDFVDRTPSLATGDVYYRIRAFNGASANNGYSRYSADTHVSVMPPTTTGPAASHSAISDKLWPQFRVTASDPSLLTKEGCDVFCFTLFVKHADGPKPFLMVPFRVDFRETDTIPGAGDDVNQHRYGFEKGKPTVRYQYLTEWWSQGEVRGDWDYAYDYANSKYTPFAYQADDGSIVIDTDSETFRLAIDNAVRRDWRVDNIGEVFMPGAYLWNLFGVAGGIYWQGDGSDNPMRWDVRQANVNEKAAYFVKGFNPGSEVFLGVSYGSHLEYGHGSPGGWFTIIIAANAK